MFAEKAKSYNRTRTGLWTLNCSIDATPNAARRETRSPGSLNRAKTAGYFEGRKLGEQSDKRRDRLFIALEIARFCDRKIHIRTIQVKQT